MKHGLGKRVFIFSLMLFTGCHKLDELKQQPEIGPLTQGFEVSAAIGYCAALANSAFNGEALPSNVTFSKSNKQGYSGSGVLHVHVTADTPLPFNHSTLGDIYIAALWDDLTGGVISIVFGDFNIIEAQFKFYGIYTVPVAKKAGSTTLNTVFAQQDIIIGQGSDTLLDLSLSRPKFDTEIARLDEKYPTDVFTAIKQNIWFVSIDANNSVRIDDDIFTINGGGQIVEASSVSGGILYHAMIQTVFSSAVCAINPTSGTAFIQNIQASGSVIDLGNITLDFHSACDGKAHVSLATGKYFSAAGQNIDFK